MSQDGRHANRTRRARRDLERLTEQSEKLMGAGSSDPPEPQDRIEILGRRIGCSIGYLFATALLIYLLATYVF